MPENWVSGLLEKTHIQSFAQPHSPKIKAHKLCHTGWHTPLLSTGDAGAGGSLGNPGQPELITETRITKKQKKQKTRKKKKRTKRRRKEGGREGGRVWFFFNQTSVLSSLSPFLSLEDSVWLRWGQWLPRPLNIFISQFFFHSASRYGLGLVADPSN